MLILFFYIRFFFNFLNGLSEDIFSNFSILSYIEPNFFISKLPFSISSLLSFSLTLLSTDTIAFILTSIFSSITW